MIVWVEVKIVALVAGLCGGAEHCELCAADRVNEGFAGANPGRIYVCARSDCGWAGDWMYGEIGEFYWGPLVGGGIESWLAYVVVLLFLLARPQGLFGEWLIERV